MYENSCMWMLVAMLSIVVSLLYDVNYDFKLLNSQNGYLYFIKLWIWTPERLNRVPNVIQSVNSEDNMSTWIFVAQKSVCVHFRLCFPVYDIYFSNSAIHLKYYSILMIAVYLLFDLVVFSKTFDQLRRRISFLKLCIWYLLNIVKNPFHRIPMDTC